MWELGKFYRSAKEHQPCQQSNDFEEDSREVTKYFARKYNNWDVLIKINQIITVLSGMSSIIRSRWWNNELSEYEVNTSDNWLDNLTWFSGKLTTFKSVSCKFFNYGRAHDMAEQVSDAIFRMCNFACQFSNISVSTLCLRPHTLPWRKCWLLLQFTPARSNLCSVTDHNFVIFNLALLT